MRMHTSRWSDVSFVTSRPVDVSPVAKQLIRGLH